MSSEGDLQEYRGNCHCGSFKFTVKLPELKDAFYCSCSICARNAYLWAFPKSNRHLNVETGDGTLKVYEFGKKTYSHYFCPTCGTSLFARAKGQPDGQELAINVRSFKGVDLDKLNLMKSDGAKLEPVFEPPPAENYPTLDSEVGEGMKLYNGSCHCGAVTYAVKHKALEDVEVMADNCSWCQRNGDLWIYPTPDEVSLRGKEAFTAYEFGSKSVRHLFCGTCGVDIGVRPKDPEKHPVYPINVRTMNGVDVESLKVKKGDARSWDPQYEV